MKLFCYNNFLQLGFFGEKHTLVFTILLTNKHQIKHAG